MALSPITRGSSVAEDGLDDIRYLLTLEAYKRYKDDEANIRRQVEDKVRLYKSQEFEYLFWYGNFVKLIKLCEMRQALEKNFPLNNELVELAKTNILKITENIQNGALCDYIDHKGLEVCKQNLTQVNSDDDLNKRQEEVAKIKDAVVAIQTAMGTVESNVEKAVVQGLNYFVAELQMKNVSSTNEFETSNCNE